MKFPHITYYLLLIPYSLFPIPCSGQDALTLEQVRAMALQHNHKVRDAELTAQVAEAAVKEYRALYLPDFSLMGAAVYGSSKRTMFEFPLSQYSMMASGLLKQPVQLDDIRLDWEFGWLWHGGVQMKQPLYMGGRIVAANSIARHSLAMARHNKRLTDCEVIEQADEAFFNIVKANELHAVACRYGALLAELEKDVRNAVDAGMKMPADLLRVQVKRNEVELQVRRAENGVRLAKMNLNHVTGRGLDEEVAVAMDWDTEPADDLAGHTSLKRAEAEIMDERTEIARQRVKVARAEMLPQVALLATYGYTNGLKVNDTRIFDGADFMGGVTVSIPLYHFGERAAKVRQAKLRLQQAENERDDVNEKLRLALAKAQNDMDEALLEASLGALGVEQAQKSLEQTQHQYEAGIATLGDLLDAQALWQKAHQECIEARSRVHTARTALLRALGAL